MVDQKPISPQRTQRDVAAPKNLHRRGRKGAQRYAGKAKAGGSSSGTEIVARREEIRHYHRKGR